MRELIFLAAFVIICVVCGVVIWFQYHKNRKKPATCYGCKYYESCGVCTKLNKKPADPMKSCLQGEFINH